MINGNWLSNLQHWINSGLHITDAQSAPIIITITVFITGGLFRYISSLIRKVSSRSATRRQFYILIEHFAVGTIKQAQEIVSSANTFNMDNLQAFHLGVVDLYQHNIIEAIGYEKVYESFFLGFENRLIFRFRMREKRLHSFHECWRALEGIPKWQQKVMDDAKFVLDYYNTQNSKRNEQLMDLEKVIYEKYISLVGSPQASVANTYMSEIMALKNKLNNQENPTSPTIVQKIYIEPGLALSELNTYSGAQELRHYFSATYLTYLNMERMLKVYTEQFGKHKIHLEAYAGALLNVIAVMKGKKAEGSKQIAKESDINRIDDPANVS